MEEDYLVSSGVRCWVIGMQAYQFLPARLGLENCKLISRTLAKLERIVCMLGHILGKNNKWVLVVDWDDQCPSISKNTMD
jgi:hypothetical protein